MRTRLWAACLLSAAAPRAAGGYELRWDADGYYRARGHYLRNLANVGSEQGRIRSAQFATQRARIEPQLTLGKIAKLQLTLDLLDDVVWGDNNARSVAPLFAVNPTDTDLHGDTIDPVKLPRAWVELMLPVGLARVGRMPSHWGLGLLANGGGTGGCEWTAPAADAADARCLDGYFDDDFGDNHFGSVNDRFLFATRPLQIVNTIAGKKDPTSNWIFAYAYDKLVEDYLNVPLERQMRARYDGAIAGGTLLPGQDRKRPYGESAWLGDNGDDVWEHVLVLLYNNPKWDPKRVTDELRGGVYIVLRSQPKSRIVCGSTERVIDPATGETRFDGPPCTGEMGRALPGDLEFVGDGSFVQIYDFWYRLRYDWLYSEAEAYWIRGDSDGGVPIGNQTSLDKKADIKALALRAGYESLSLDAIGEVGFNSGDDDLADREYTQRPSHPDYNVGLLLYEEILREMTARTIGRLGGLGGYFPNSHSLQSNGGVINSWYVNPRVKLRPPAAGGLELVLGFLAAWVDEQGGLPPWLARACPQGVLSCTGEETAVSSFLGWEIDAAVKYRWADDHFLLTLEGGYLRFGDALRRASWHLSSTPEGINALRDEVGGAATVQSRLAFTF